MSRPWWFESTNCFGLSLYFNAYDYQVDEIDYSCSTMESKKPTKSWPTVKLFWRREGGSSSITTFPNNITGLRCVNYNLVHIVSSFIGYAPQDWRWNRKTKTCVEIWTSTNIVIAYYLHVMINKILHCTLCIMIVYKLWISLLVKQ